MKTNIDLLEEELEEAELYLGSAKSVIRQVLKKDHKKKPLKYKEYKEKVSKE